MEIKKTKEADLEKKKGMYLQLGLVVVLSIILIAFEWTSRPPKDDDSEMVKSIQVEDDIMQVTRREEPPKQEQIEQPKVAEVLDIVDDDVQLDDDFDFNMEADANTEYDFANFGDDDEDIQEEEVFFIVEDMPLFNGGKPEDEFRKYIGQNLRYPEIASENGISGRVIVQFTVNSKGQVTDAVVVRSVDPALDKEAIRVVMSSPKWTPGKQRGRPVSVLFTFPINFVLQ